MNIQMQIKMLTQSKDKRLYGTKCDVDALNAKWAIKRVHIRISCSSDIFA